MDPTGTKVEIMTLKNSRIILDMCDSCGTTKKVPCVTLWHNQQHILSQCQFCDPGNFALQAQRDKDRWLRGEE
jgi:hypothetical protein